MDPQHSFGGRSMDRYLVDFETDPSGLDGEAGAVPSPDVDATGEAVAPAAATETTPAWSPDNPDFVRAVEDRAAEVVQAQLGPLVELLQQNTFADPGQQQTPGLPDFDPLDPDSVRAYNDARDQRMLSTIQQLIGQVAQPLQAQQDAAREQAGEENLKDMLADDIARNGEFSTDPEADKRARQMVRTLAENVLPSYTQRYGFGARAAEASMAHAAREVRALLGPVRQQGAAEHANRTATLAGVHGEPGTGVPGVETVSDVPLSPRQLAQKFGARALNTAA